MTDVMGDYDYAHDTRTCTCHPDDNPPKPCARKYAYSECSKTRGAKMKRFFSYDDQNEFEFHDTLAEAKAAAEKAFEYCSDEARSDGWPESVDHICYGELRGHVVESLREPWDTNKHGAAPEEGCEHVEYTLQDLPHNA